MYDITDDILYLFLLQLNTPVKRVSMTGRRVEERNGQHFTVEGNIDNRDLRADVKLNNGEPGFDINIQVDRGKNCFILFCFVRII